MSRKEKKTEKGEKSIDDYTLKSGILSERFTTKEVMIEGTSFTIRSLPELLISFCHDRASYKGEHNPTLQIVHTCRFGIVEIKPAKGSKLLDQNGKVVKFELGTENVLGWSWDVIPYSIIRRLKMTTLIKLFKEIVSHSTLTQEEGDSVDFTTASETAG